MENVKLKQIQSTYYDEEIDTEFETTRPHGTPLMYRRLLDSKFSRSVAALGPLAGKTALTVCGGSGMDAEYLARAGATVIHSDLSPRATHRAQQRFQRYLLPPRTGEGREGGFLVADVESLPFPNRSFDLIYVHDGLHHLENPFAGLREMCRVSRCAISLTEPAQAAATRLAVKLGKAQEIEEAGNRVARLDPAQIARFLESQGFQVVASERYAMYYKHHPGPVMRLLSLPGIHQLAWFGYRAANSLIGKSGNKLIIQAMRAEHPHARNSETPH